MAFTPVTITGTFVNPDGTPANGTVTATLLTELQNGTTTLSPRPITGVLIAGGLLKLSTGAPMVLDANDDVGTTPTNSYYTFRITLDGAPSTTFSAVVSHSAPGGTVDISALVPLTSLPSLVYGVVSFNTRIGAVVLAGADITTALPSVVTDAATTPHSIDSTGVVSGQVLAYDVPSGKFKPVTASGGVASVFSRTGIVVAASGDYTVAQVTGAAPLVENVNTVAASGAAQTIPDVTVDTVNAITLTAACTFTFPTVVAGKSFLLALKQDATGGRTATWPATVKWAGGTAPTLTATAAKTDIVAFACTDGASWFGTVVGMNF